MTKFDDYDPVALRTPTLTLEPIRGSHAAETFGYLCDPGHYTFIPQQPPKSLVELRERYERLESGGSPNGRELWLNWAVRLHAGDIAGLVQATAYLDGRVAIAYEFFVPFRGRGVATEAIRAALLHLRDGPQLTKATALVDTRNVKSIRLLERLGFVRTRFIKDADFFKGATSHEYRYELDLTSWSST